MATANTNPSSSNNQPIGTTLVVHGPVQAQSTDNGVRLLQVGSPVFLHDRIITGNDGMISIVFGDAARTQLDLGRMSDVVLDEDVFQGTEGDFSEATAEVEQIQEALLAGDFDPTTDLEPTAAGPAAGGPASDGGGSSYVEFSLTGEEVTPTSGAETTGVGLNFLNPPLVEIEEPLEPAPEPEAFVTAAAPTPTATPTFTPVPTAADIPDVPPPPPPPINSLPSAGEFSSFVEERGLEDGTDGPDSSLTTTSGTFAQLGIDFGGDGEGYVTFSHGSATVTAVLDGDHTTTWTLPGTYGTLTIFGDGTWEYEITDNTIDHPDNTTADGDGTTGADDSIPDNFTFSVFDSNGDTAPGTLTINIYDDGPVAALQSEGIRASVEEDDMRQGDGDKSDGYNEDGSINFDEDSGVSGSLAQFFTVGADDPGTYGITEDPSLLANLTPLFSKSEPVSYSSDGSTLTATAGGRVVFTLTVEDDGSWKFDLKDQLDHHDDNANNENFDLVTTGDPVGSIDFSSIITVTDADGDMFTGAAEGSFLITVQDDTPFIGTPQDSILALEEGNSLTASLDIASGADEPASLNITLTEGAPVLTTAGFQMTSDGKSLFWHENENGSWSAVTKGESGNLDPDAKSFTVSVDLAAGTYTVVQDGLLDGTTKTIDFDKGDDLHGGNKYEAVFGEGGSSTTTGTTTTYTAGVFIWARGSENLDDPFGWDSGSDTDTWGDDPATVNWSNKGIGIGTDAKISGSGGDDGSARNSQVLSLKFFSTIAVDESGNGQDAVRVDESHSTTLNLTGVTLVLDHLGSTESAYYTLWHDGEQVSGQFEVNNPAGTPNGNSDDDITLVIDSNTVFDEVRLESSGSAPNGGEYRVQSAQVNIVQEGYDQTVVVPFELTDNDGDTASDNFSITFDGDNNINAKEADAADDDVSTNGMVISGSSLTDDITGTDYNDTILGGGGNDFIDGGSGDDSIDGGAGNDIIYGGGNNDTIQGGAGNDFIDGESGDDSIDGEAGTDLLVGGIGDDVIYGGDGGDGLAGNSGNDQLVGGTGSDILTGGQGDDVLVGDDVDFNDPTDPIIVEDNAPDIIIGGPGTDTAGDQPPSDLIFTESTQDDIDTLIPPPDDVV